MFKLSFIVVFFLMVPYEKLFRRSSLTYRTLRIGWSNVKWSISLMLLEKMKCCYKLSKNGSIHAKNSEISGPYNFWTSIKNNIPDVWNWNCWIFFGSEVEVEGTEGHGPPWPLPVVVFIDFFWKTFDQIFDVHRYARNVKYTKYKFCTWYVVRQCNSILDKRKR